jgi:23S rRNA pseudouridine2605 synthase
MSEQWIREGRVAVNGQVVTELGTKADVESQRITVDGRPVPKPPARLLYIAVNKPKGVTCTVSDVHAERLITELVDLPGRPALKPVGRLDANSEGLIFLSDDGAFIYRLTHPKYHVVKTYIATVRGTPAPEAITLLAQGIKLEDGLTAPADRVHVLKSFPDNDTCDVEIAIHEGRKRQIRRMFDFIDRPVLRLVRTRIGEVTLGGLPAGAWRHLTKTEIAKLIGHNPAIESAQPAAVTRSRSTKKGFRNHG